jgi:peptidyl-prolyl cis-trans isomerase SurA
MTFMWQGVIQRVMTLSVLMGLWAMPLVNAQEANKTADGPQLVDEVAAIVNNGVITRRELQEHAQYIARQLSAAGRPVPEISTFYREVLERMILERIQQQRAEEHGFRVSDAELQAAIAQLAQQNSLTVPALFDEITKSGLTIDKYREQLRREITMVRLRQREIDGTVKVSEIEIDALVAEKNGKTVSLEDELNIAQILVGMPESAPPTLIRDVRAKAERLFELAKSGVSFADIVRREADLVGSVRTAELGYRAPERLPRLFTDAVAELEPGQLVPELVRSPNGFHILRLLGRRAPVPAVTGAERENVRRALRENKTEQAYQEWLQQLRAAAYVDIRTDLSH